MDTNAMEDLIRTRMEILRANTTRCLAANERFYLLGVIACYLAGGGKDLTLVDAAQYAVKADMLRWTSKEVLNDMYGTVAEEVRV